MTTGLFPSRGGRGGPRPGYVPKNRRAGYVSRSVATHAHLRRDLTEFAEAIANGKAIVAAGRMIGVGKQRSYQLFAKMKRDLGAQAR